MKRKLSKVKKIFEIFLFIALLSAIFVMISSRTAIISEIRSMVVLSGSMEPHIPVGSIVLVQKVWPYKKGDIISFKNSGGQTVTHRIVEKTSIDNTLYFRVKGDTNNAPDGEFIPENAVIGKEFMAISYLGRIVVYLKTIPGFFIFIILPTLIFISIELWNINKEIVKETEKKFLAQIAKLENQNQFLNHKS